MRAKVFDSSYGLILLGLILLLTVYRVLVITQSGLSLDYEEAYYFGWARTLELGYYSKPPMIAWLIGLTTRVCGDGELCVKSGTLLAYPVIIWLTFLIGRHLFDARVGFWSSLALATTPAASFSALFVTTDVVLILFWTLALYFFIRALERDDWSYWLAAGIAGGLGMLSKYTMVLFPLSALVYLAMSPDAAQAPRAAKALHGHRGSAFGVLSKPAVELSAQLCEPYPHRGDLTARPRAPESDKDARVPHRSVHRIRTYSHGYLRLLGRARTSTCRR